MICLIILVDVTIIPNAEWNKTSEKSLLGLTLRSCNADKAIRCALEQVWHILEVIEGSPVESAGLVPYGDWVIGWPGGVLKQENDFYDLVEMVSYFNFININIFLY